MKKQLVIGIVMTLVIAAIAIVPTPIAHTEDDPDVRTLFAGQDIDVGTVSVWNDEENIYVKYELSQDAIDDGWCITETHVHVGESLDDFPRGGKLLNPVPGLFDFSDPHGCVEEYMYTIPLNDWEVDDVLLLAAHAVIQRCETEAFSFSPELTWQRSSEETVAVFPGYGAQWTQAEGFAIGLDPDAMVWDGGTTEQYFTGYSTRDDISWASWICTQNPGGKSLAGTDLRRFQATFDIPEGYLMTGGTLGSVNPGYEDVIPMNDNIYIFVNEELIFWGGTISLAGLDPARTHFLGLERRPTEPQNKAAFPETDGWHMDGAIPEISSSLFVEGVNVLDVFAEELWTGGGMHELGLTLDVEETTCETETAWADGTRFTEQGNWATYFSYTVQEEQHEWVLFDTFIVPATTATPTSSNEILEDGVEYKIEAVGTYFFRNEGNTQGYLADAEWADRNDAYGTGWTKGDEPPYSFPYNGLDLCFAADINTDWGDLDDTDHTYSVLYIGEGSTVSLFIKDNVYSDNSGFLTVNIYEWV